ncbi:MAG: zinc-binding dehydrogenase [Coriobacteriales bacterium]
MKTNIYRLLKPGVFGVEKTDADVQNGSAVVRPTYLSICAADQRYWSGRRDPEALKKKLPMALIHEAVGVVVDDPTGQLAAGTSVVMVPNMPDPEDEDKASKENYSRASKFCSSGIDGFMRDYVVHPVERLVPFEGIDPLVAVMAELTSVCLNAYESFEQVRHVNRNHTIGIWGDGAVGYMMAAVIREENPDAHLIIFGTHDSKIAKFDFADEAHNIRKDFKQGFPTVDHAFECVGGTSGSQSAIDQIIAAIRPQGVISLMGVSEQHVPINTRMVLEKGLTLQGNSRSSKEDFEHAVELFEHRDFSRRVRNIVQHVTKVETVDDAQRAFEFDEKNPFKTVMEWATPVE